METPHAGSAEGAVSDMFSEHLYLGAGARRTLKIKVRVCPERGISLSGVMGLGAAGQENIFRALLSPSSSPPPCGTIVVGCFRGCARMMGRAHLERSTPARTRALILRFDPVVQVRPYCVTRPPFKTKIDPFILQHVKPRLQNSGTAPEMCASASQHGRILKKLHLEPRGMSYASVCSKPCPPNGFGVG